MLGCAQSLTAQNITFTLSKSSDAPSPIPSGQAFTYTLTYGWSGGAPGTLTITDVIPSSLDIISTLPGSPQATVLGNTVTFALTGPAFAASAGAGTVQINARFKPGVTCTGTRACNTASIQLASGQNISSNTVCVTATAANKWTFEKALVSGCAVDNDVIFRICAINPSGGDIGGLNLTNVVLNDVVPAGAIVTSVSGSWSSFTQTGTSVALTGGPSTLPVSPWNAWYCVYVHVTFPSPTFVQGQTVINNASLTYMTPCDTTKTQRYTDTAAVTLCAAHPQGNLWKSLSINMFFPSNPYYYPSFSPGCCGTYTLQYNNSGNVAQPGFVMTDNLPTTVDVTSVTTNVPAGNAPVTMSLYCWVGVSCSAVACTTVTYPSPGSFTLTTIPGNICKIQWTYGGSIAISQSLVNYINVCVRPASFAPPFTAVTVGQNIINTVTAQATNLSLLTATHTKPVDSLRPKILASKFFMGSCGPGCSPLNAGPFVPGNIVRWRMAVANVGNVNASPCTITDVLPAGLTYVGNPTYIDTTVNWGASQWNPPCCSLSATVPAAVGGTITTPAVGATNLTWTFPTLPFECDGTVKYFIIEFDVKISDSPPAPPGQYNNTFTFAAANLPTPVTSNVATLTVNAIAQLTLAKEVRPKLPAGGPWSATTTVPAGTAIEFRLRLTNTGNLTLNNICLLDIMPHVGDIMVLPGYGPRSSAFDLPLTSAAVTVPAGYTTGYNSSANTKNPRRSVVCGGFCGITDPGAGVGVGPLTTGTFGAFSSSTYSFSVSGGSTTLAPGGNLDIIVGATVPASATVGQSACNNFAVQATPVGTTSCLGTQAVPSCVTVGQKPVTCEGLWLEGRADSCCAYRITLGNAIGPIASLQYNVLGGSGLVQNVQTSPCLPSSTVPASLAGTTTGLLNFSPACIGPMQLGIEAQSTTSSGNVCIELIAVINKNGEKIPCRDTICFHCRPSPKVRCDSMTVKPFPFQDLDLSGRTFTIYNMKVPVSPICSVKISVVPPPAGPGVNGGGLYIDGIWKPWPFGTSVGYTQILPVHGTPANSTVQFNLGIDYTIGWVGNVNITIYHCDGDSCTTTYGPWKATKKDIAVVATPIDISEKARLHVHRLSFPHDKASGKHIRAFAFRYRDPVESIVAVTGASFGCDTTAECDDLFESLRVKGRLLFVELRHELDFKAQGGDPFVTVLYTASTEKQPTVDIIYYDGSGQEIGRDSAIVTGSTLRVDDPAGMPGPLGSLTAQPNPTNGACDISFRLPSAATIELDLLDALGRRVSSVITGERLQAGTHVRTVDLSPFPSGSYLVALRVNGVPTVLKVELVR